MLLLSIAWAAEATPLKQPSLFEKMMPFVFIFLLLYFLFIRPAQKKQKKHQTLIDQLKKGDSVITSSGILGIIYGLTDNFVILEVADNTRIRILRSQISSLVEPETGKLGLSLKEKNKK
ncbi:MAG: preprotein translocase subunit YajC [Oligoflexia bacterium]|nr:preprotein translocase subunit YajC [Oligoflexia bacterium]